MQKALKEANYDREQAMVLLRQRSRAVAARMTDRAASAGTIALAYGPQQAVLVELLCSTDYTAMNADLLGVAQQLA